MNYIMALNNNKILWGLTMLMLNLGSRYVVADISKLQEKILMNEIVKKFIIFSMFFVATRDILTSFLLCVLYIIIIDGIFHENRKYTFINQNNTNDDLYDTYIANINK